MPPDRWINLELRDSTGAPLSRRSYSLTLPDGTRRTGHLDEDGYLHEALPAEVGSVALDVAQRRFELDLGGLPPSTSVEGAQERLNHLNYFAGKTDDQLGPRTRQALIRFQRDHHLPESGELDEATVARLVEEHGV